LRMSLRTAWTAPIALSGD